MVIHGEQGKEIDIIKDFIKRIVEWYNIFKVRADEVLNGTKAEGNFRIDPSIFTPEQNAAFDRIADFLARMVEKYYAVIDEIQKAEPDESENQKIA